MGDKLYGIAEVHNQMFPEEFNRQNNILFQMNILPYDVKVRRITELIDEYEPEVLFLEGESMEGLVKEGVLMEEKIYISISRIIKGDKMEYLLELKEEDRKGLLSYESTSSFSPVQSSTCGPCPLNPCRIQVETYKPKD